MLSRCKFLISPMANINYKTLSKRDHHTLTNVLPYESIDTSVIKSLCVRNRSYVSIPDVNQMIKEDPVLDADFNIYTKNNMKLMFEPLNYYIKMPKENIGPCLLKGFNYWMNLSDDTLETIKEMAEIYYEILIMCDDTHDQSDYRRGLPAGHKVFGAPLTYVSGQAGLFLVMKKLIELNNMKAIEAYVNAFLKFCVVTYKEIHCRQNMICPDVKEYDQLFCKEKADGILGSTIKLMQLFSNNTADYSKLIKLLYLHQIYQNDISNLCEEKCSNTKGFCEDISEGKCTLAAIHAINSGTLEGQIVMNIYRQKTKDLPTLKYCLSLMEKLGSIDFAKKATATAEENIRKEIQRLGGNPPLTEYVDAISSWGYDEKFEKN